MVFKLFFIMWTLFAVLVIGTAAVMFCLPVKSNPVFVKTFTAKLKSSSGVLPIH
ncbi:hypothetical protein HanRHA438_Chr09g0402551 [Helianthus annuus]|nr:hypothetical protein HanRHA438_Chr09g0402551 [Helianthus annuus]